MQRSQIAVDYLGERDAVPARVCLGRLQMVAWHSDREFRGFRVHLIYGTANLQALYGQGFVVWSGKRSGFGLGFKCQGVMACQNQRPRLRLLGTTALGFGFVGASRAREGFGGFWIIASRAGSYGGGLLVVGCWLLVVGCWLLVVGCWLLVVGCWLLVVGWSLCRFGESDRRLKSGNLEAHAGCRLGHYRICRGDELNIRMYGLRKVQCIQCAQRMFRMTADQIGRLGKAGVIHRIELQPAPVDIFEKGRKQHGLQLSRQSPMRRRRLSSERISVRVRLLMTPTSRA